MRSLPLVTIVALMLALAACGGSLPGSISEAPAPKIDMAGRWLLSTANAPTCGMSFTQPSPEGGNIAPEGGCPGNFFTSRHWAFEGGDLVIRDHNSEPLAQLQFAGGRFTGKSTAGLTVTLARSLLPSN